MSAVFRVYDGSKWVTPAMRAWADDAWRTVGGAAPDVIPDTFVLPTGPTMNVLGSAASVGGTWSTTSTEDGAASITRHRVTANVQDPVLTWEVRPPGLGGIPTVTATMRAMIASSTAPDTWHELTFSGSPTATLPYTAGTVTADPVNMRLYGGTDALVLVWIHADGPGTPVGSQTRIVSGYDIGSYKSSWADASDGVLSGTASPGVLRPSRIAAPTDTHSWFYAGDSIAAQHDSHGERAFRSLGWASVKAAQGGEGFYHFPGRWDERFSWGLPHVDSVLCQYGTNDLGQAIATVQSNAVKLWNQINGAGITRLVQTTVTPQASSTDGFATVANQTPGSNAARRNEFNDWLLDGAPLLNGTATATGTTDPAAVRAGRQGHPVTAVIDINPVVESAPKSGVWKAPGIGGDGTHPTAEAHRLMGELLAAEMPNVA